MPELRFPEFKGEWEAQKLGERTVKVGSGVTPKGGATSYVESGIPLLRSQNVRDNELSLADVAYISNHVHDNMSGSKVAAGDVLLNITGASIGRSCVVPEIVREANVNQHVCIIRLRESASPKFLQTLLSSVYGQKWIFQSQAGGGREGLNFENIRSFKVNFPSLPEQQKIADFLGAVDEKIGLLAKKKALLEDYKKGCMQKLFSRQLRFNDDNGNDFPDWEEKRLGDVLTIGSGRDHQFLGTGSIPVYGTGGFMRNANDYLYDGESVCIGRKGTIDAPFLVEGKFWTVDTLFYTHSFVDVLPKFLLAVFQQINWQKHNEASGVPSLSKGTIENLKAHIPQIDEQRKVANFLTAIDTKITLTTQKLDQAKAFKKGLLQQMFV